MQKTAFSTSRPNAAFNEAYSKIWFSGTAPKPRASLSLSTLGVENPSRLARIMRSKKSESKTSTRPVHATQLQLGPFATLATQVDSPAYTSPHMAHAYPGNTFLPTRIERKPVKGAYVRTTTPLPREVISRPTDLEIRSPRPTRSYNKAVFLSEGEYASQMSDSAWGDQPPCYQSPSWQALQPSPSSPFYLAWPSSSFALYIPSLGIAPSPVPQRDPMDALLNYNALCQPRLSAAEYTFQFDPFGDDSEEGASSPVSNSPSASSSLSSPTSGGSPNSEWAKLYSPIATGSTTSLESNAETDAGSRDGDTFRDAVRVSVLILALDERKLDMADEEYEVEMMNILALWSEAYEKVKHVVDAGA